MLSAVDITLLTEPDATRTAVLDRVQRPRGGRGARSVYVPLALAPATHYELADLPPPPRRDRHHRPAPPDTGAPHRGLGFRFFDRRDLPDLGQPQQLPLDLASGLRCLIVVRFLAILNGNCLAIFRQRGSSLPSWAEKATLALHSSEFGKCQTTIESSNGS
jgi:hypothetical protein